MVEDSTLSNVLNLHYEKKGENELNASYNDDVTNVKPRRITFNSSVQSHVGKEPHSEGSAAKPPSGNRPPQRIPSNLHATNAPTLASPRYGVKFIGAAKWSPHQSGSNLAIPWRHTKRVEQRRGACFVSTVIMFIGFEYLVYAIMVLPSLFDAGAFGIAYIIFFHLFFSLMLTSFIQTSLTDPGVVPANWGFYMGDESKRRRYCKVCDVWKPDRTHHCSACGRCVLHMDHHCPWVNNCIGFGNRKFFIQLLCYALLCVSSVIVHGTHFLLVNGSELVPREVSVNKDNFLGYLKDVIVCSCSIIVRVILGSFATWGLYSCYFFQCFQMLLFAVLLGIPLIPFTKFHLSMIARNSSTIENMDVLNKTRGLYDLGTLRNLQQVMGPNWFLWWLPFHIPYSKPVGDGVRWRQQYWKALDTNKECF